MKNLLLLISVLGALVVGFVIGRWSVPLPVAAAEKELLQKSAPKAPRHGQSEAFPDLIKRTTGSQVIAFDQGNPVHDEILKVISEAAAVTTAHFNQRPSPLAQVKRINEASRYFEDQLLQTIDDQPAFSCRRPLNREGKVQHSGYPDLQVTHHQSGTVAYLDPKLFKLGTEGSSFRSFYFQPNPKTLKVNTDALHLLLGFSHDGKPRRWRFQSAKVVDLSQLSLTLKEEYAASNKELYQKALPAAN